MSFSFETIATPIWIIIILVGATLLWIKCHKKNNKTKTTEEMKANVLKKATEHWNANSKLSDFTRSGATKINTVKKNIDPVKKQNIRAVLLELAERGDAGVLPTSISDATGINTLDVSAALAYLTDKKYAEAVNSPIGVKYYLTQLGRKYCISKKFITDL